MLSYLKVENIDNELIEFHLRQKNYYSLEGQVVTREYLINEMRCPDGFDEIDHCIEKCYLEGELVGLVDYQYGYRYSMIHDDECVWIGLFLIDQDKQNCGLGKRLFNDCLKKFKQRCERIQLACLVRNEAGLVFWKKCGFNEIGNSKYGDLPVIVLEKRI